MTQRSFGAGVNDQGRLEREVQAAWAAEIERRAREALANLDDDFAWEMVRAELHASSTPR